MDDNKDKKAVSKGYSENDKFHTGLLFGTLVIAFGLNYAFGFQAGTIPYGIMFTLAIIIWLIIAIVYYFRG